MAKLKLKPGRKKVKALVYTQQLNEGYHGVDNYGRIAWSVIIALAVILLFVSAASGTTATSW